eukprot:TRINITY_DN3572_c0_g1_i5.p1 TRINITY_DN3572_c0_g1~~TRINITY_DN3572_c0_g1_i5.p1  ORF type:complete len:105 (+),score=58.66 TRINITY_DN3572_c0_g1_i5:109-423(+)
MIRRPPRSTQSRSSAASDVYKRQNEYETSVYTEWSEWILETIGTTIMGMKANCRVVSYWNLPVSYTHLRAHETVLDLVCRLLLEKKKKKIKIKPIFTYDSAKTN